MIKLLLLFYYTVIINLITFSFAGRIKKFNGFHMVPWL